MDRAPASPTVRAGMEEAEPSSPGTPRMSRLESDITGCLDAVIVSIRLSAHRLDGRKDERHRAEALREGHAQRPRRGLTDEQPLSLCQSSYA